MKTTSTKIAMVFIFLVQLVLAQDAHEQFETTFSDLTINQVVETLKIKKRYAEEFKVQELVDLEYSTFQSTLHNELESKIELTEQEIKFRIQSFLLDLENKTKYIPKNPSENSPVKMLDGPCVNLDFEDGDLNGWDLSIGETDGSVIYSYVNEVPAGPGPNHQIYGGGVDPVVGISRVNPGGAFSVRLGNGAVNGAGAARMSQTFLVDASNYFFTYSYAVVFQNPNNHTPEERPYFTVRVYDELGGNIDCGEYSVYADPLNATDYLSVGDVLYKDWSTVFTNLSAYIGQNITIEFTSGDCSLGGHYGYVYLDASCGLQDITATEYDICPGETSTLSAPNGIGSYLWNTGETTQSITVNTGGTYTCLLTPLQGASCSIMLDIVVNMLQEPIASFSLFNSSVCLGEPVVFTDNSTVSAPATIISYQWNFGNGIVSPASSGVILGVSNTSGTYLLPEHDYAASDVYNPSLTIVTNEGCTATFSLPLTVNPLPAVVAGLDQDLCEGNQVSLTGAGANTYSWDNGVTDGLAFNPPIGVSLYTVTGTTSEGCESTDQVEITVYALPIVNAGLDQTVCFGEQVTLSGSGALNYTWDNGITDGDSFIPLVGSIHYNLTGTDINGCENNDNVEVIVHALPIVDAGVDHIICSGVQVTLSGSGALNYSWDNGISNGIAFTPAVGTIIYTLTGTTINGCEDIDQVSVTVNPLPIVDAGLDQTVCDGTTVVLSASGAINYSWNNGVVDGVPFIPTVGIHNYTVIGTDINGCENNDVVQVVINPNPMLEAGSNQFLCEGESVVLNANGASVYVWNNGVVNGMSFIPSIGIHTFTVIGSFATGCNSTDSLTVTVNPSPIVTTHNAEICRGEAVTLKGFGADAYFWTNDVIDNVAFYPTSSGDYFVTGTTIFGCSNTAMAKVIVHELPIANFYMTNNDFSIINPSSIFMNTSSGAVSYIWDFNDGSPLSDEVSPFHEFPSQEIGTYTVQLTAISNFGCKDSTVRIIEIKEELLFYVPNAFTPDNDNFNNVFNPVFMDGFEPRAYTLYIFNRWGQIVFESHDTSIGWNGHYGVDGEHAQDGVYTWKIILRAEHSNETGVYVGHVSLLR